MFSVIRGGCFSRHPNGFIMQRPNGLPYHVLLLIKSPAEIIIDGKLHTCKPNSALFIRPNTPYSYRNPSGEYIDDWLHFTGNPEDVSCLPDSLFHHSFPVSNIRLLTTYIQQILWENNFTNEEEKGYYVDSLFHILLRHIAEDFRNGTYTEYNPYQYKLQKIRLELSSAPYHKYTAKDFSDRLEISVSYFQSLYKTLFGVSFQADIISMRVDYAKELIISTNLPLEQIAYSCGYSNEVHFYRQFLSKTGMTPGDYRKNYRIQLT
ncbi:MAG: helix-turn-helix domain-containing protein [Lachnospiraceae bacterium]|nr:helix-turn-helix domain-containing protein [Lachnospiraceae bacterium]